MNRPVVCLVVSCLTLCSFVATSVEALLADETLLITGCHADPEAVFGDCDWPPQMSCSDLWTRDKLAGDVFGLRPAVGSSGIKFDVNSTQYYQGVAAGGLEQGFRYGGRADYLVNMHGQELGLWKGFLIDLHAETRYGQSVNGITGPLLPPNLMMALPAPNETVTALTGVKFTQFLSETSLVFAGKFNNFDGFFQQITHAGTTDGFMTTALMIPPTIARIVPYSSFGAGYAYLHNMEPVFSFLVLDSNNTPTVSGFDTFFDNGVTLVWQVNVPTNFMEMPGHQGFLAAYTNAQKSSLGPTAYFDPTFGFVFVSPQQTGGYSFTYSFDQALYVSPDDPRRKWGLFGNISIADTDPSPIHWNASIGFAGSSPLRCRPLDTFGIGYSYSEVSSVLKNAFPVLLPLENEQVVELYYNIGVTKWFHITPDVQIYEPARINANTALLVGVRARIDF